MQPCAFNAQKEPFGYLMAMADAVRFSLSQDQAKHVQNKFQDFSAYPRQKAESFAINV